MLAYSRFDPQFSQYVAFAAVSEPVVAYTAARREFLGRNGTLSAPAALLATGMTRGHRRHNRSLCRDAVRARACAREDASARRIVLGARVGEDEARRAGREVSGAGSGSRALDETLRSWQRAARRHLGQDARADLRRDDEPLVAVSGALVPHVGAGSALYQSSGAFGFRDQLQDVMAFVYAEPELAREHILRVRRASSRKATCSTGGIRKAAAECARGSRTISSGCRIVVEPLRATSPATPRYSTRTVPYLDDARSSSRTSTSCTICRSVARSASRSTITAFARCDERCTAGEHGLPLIGIGDWNDGMNRVGIEGKGESVWLAWFLDRHAPKIRRARRQRAATAASRESCAAQADATREAVEAAGWDGEWYRRAYFDDGTPLGSRENDECQIDSIAQSWSVISRRGRARAQRSMAMKSLNEHLVREDARLIMLLTPPFDDSTHDPGYIQGYLPGVRENGAQYTHAALWAVLATALQGDGDRAFELYQMINPLTHALTPEDVRDVQSRAVRRRGGRVHGRRASRARRLDVVHGLGELDVSRWARSDSRIHQARRYARDGSVHSARLEGILDRVQARLDSTYSITVRNPTACRAGSSD